VLKQWPVWEKYLHDLLPAGHIVKSPPHDNERPQINTLDASVLPFSALSTHALIAIIIRGVCLPKYAGGFMAGSAHDAAAALLQLLVHGSTDSAGLTWTVYAKRPRWDPPLHPTGEQEFSIQYDGEFVDCNQLVEKLQNTDEGSKAKQQLERCSSDLLQGFGNRCCLHTFLCFAGLCWPELYMQIIWAIGNAVEEWVDAHRPGTKRDSVENRYRVIQELLSGKSTTTNQKEHDIIQHMNAAKECFADSMLSSKKLSCCTDFGRIMGKNKMITGFAVPAGYAEWAPQQDLAIVNAPVTSKALSHAHRQTASMAMYTQHPQLVGHKRASPWHVILWSDIRFRPSLVL